MNKVANLILLLILLNVLLFSAYFLYQNFPGELQEFKILGQVIGDIDVPEIYASDSVTQFYHNMRFNHNDISYYINSECDDGRVKRVEEAFAIIETQVDSLSFFKTGIEANADILVACSPDTYEKQKNLFIVGEGGPTKIINSSLYPIILKGKVILYNESSCDKPITELHEIFHVLGFDHINNSKMVMYPYVNCNQDINPNLIDMLEDLYSVEPFSELYFSNITAYKKGRYLFFDTLIKNRGMINAHAVALEVYDSEEIIDEFDLGIIEFGAGKSFYVKNLRLLDRNTDKIKIKINSRTQELDDKNNVLELKI